MAESRNLGTTFDRQKQELNMLRQSLLMNFHFMVDFEFCGFNDVPFVEGEHKNILFACVQIHGNKT